MKPFEAECWDFLFLGGLVLHCCTLLRNSGSNIRLNEPLRGRSEGTEFDSVKLQHRLHWRKTFEEWEAKSKSDNFIIGENTL